VCGEGGEGRQGKAKGRKRRRRSEKRETRVREERKGSLSVRGRVMQGDVVVVVVVNAYNITDVYTPGNNDKLSRREKKDAKGSRVGGVIALLHHSLTPLLEPELDLPC